MKFDGAIYYVKTEKELNWLIEQLNLLKNKKEIFFIKRLRNHHDAIPLNLFQSNINGMKAVFYLESELAVTIYEGDIVYSDLNSLTLAFPTFTFAKTRVWLDAVKPLENHKRIKLKEIRFDKDNGATIAFWNDNTKTVVATRNGETFDPEKGIALCFMKKQLGNTGSYNEVFKAWITEEEK